MLNLWSLLYDWLFHDPNFHRGQIDFECYYYGAPLLWTDYYTYSPLFSWAILPLTWLPLIFAQIIWLVFSLACLGYGTYMFRRDKLPFWLYIFNMITIKDGNVDFFYFLVFQYLILQEFSGREGFILGICFIKPTFLFILPYFLYHAYKGGDGKKWFIGFAIGMILNWGYFAFLFLQDFSLFWDWISAMLDLYTDNRSKGQFWGLHYAWLWLILWRSFKELQQARILKLPAVKIQKKVEVLWHHSL